MRFKTPLPHQVLRACQIYFSELLKSLKLISSLMVNSPVVSYSGNFASLIVRPLVVNSLPVKFSKLPTSGTMAEASFWVEELPASKPVIAPVSSLSRFMPQYFFKNSSPLLAFLQSRIILLIASSALLKIVEDLIASFSALLSFNAAMNFLITSCWAAMQTISLKNFVHYKIIRGRGRKTFAKKKSSRNRWSCQLEKFFVRAKIPACLLPKAAKAV